MNRNFKPVNILLFEPEKTQRVRLREWLQSHDHHVRVQVFESEILPAFVAGDTTTHFAYDLVVFCLSSVDLTKMLEMLKDDHGIPLVPVVVLIDQPGEQGEIVISSCLIEVPVFVKADCEQQQDVQRAMHNNRSPWFNHNRSRLVAVRPDRAIVYALARQAEFQKIRNLLPELFLFHYGDTNGNNHPTHPDASPTILLLETSKYVQRKLKNYLTAYGYRVFAVSSDQELLAWCQQTTPALILISGDAKGKTGRPETIQHIHTLPTMEHVPIIVLDSVATLENRSLSQETGGASYLGRPFGMHELLQKIEQYVPVRQTVQEVEIASS
jgi:CheY-like chemotaxis protein